MKKSVSAIMAALMAASVVLAGCGSGNTGATAAETAAGRFAFALQIKRVKSMKTGFHRKSPIPVSISVAGMGDF